MKSVLRITALLLAAAYAAAVGAQGVPARGGKWEFTLQPQYTHGKSFSTGHGSGGETDSSLGFGFGVGYNLNNNFNVAGEFTWANSAYTATIADAGTGATTTITGTMNTSTFRLSGTWNMLPGDFTPLAQVGIGSTYLNTNIPIAPPQNTCWWDPWWGYVCGSYQPTRTAYYISYLDGLGVRWEIDRSIFVRALVIRQWLQAGGSLGTTWFDQYRVDLGFKF